jgi:hypothetical protein
MAYRIAQIWPGQADRSDERTPYGPPVPVDYCTVRGHQHRHPYAFPVVSDEVDPDKDRWAWSGLALCLDHWGDESPPDSWTHDPARDGQGCSWCGAWVKVDSDNLCPDCWED